jgi:hypothetical protein
MEGANHLLGTLNLPNTCKTNVAMMVSINWPSPGPNGAGGGVAAPWLSPNQAIFVALPPMIIWTWPMVVFCAVEMFGLGFGPVLHLFLLYFAWLWASLHWACVEWYLCFVLLHIFSPFMCISTNALLQMVNHQNSWNLLVVSPNSKCGDQLCRFYVRIGG